MLAKKYEEEGQKRIEERNELEKLKKQSLEKPLADYVPNKPKKDTTI